MINVASASVRDHQLAVTLANCQVANRDEAFLFFTAYKTDNVTSGCQSTYISKQIRHIFLYAQPEHISAQNMVFF